MSSDPTSPWIVLGAIIGSVTGIFGTLLGCINIYLREKDKKINGELEVTLPIDEDSTFTVFYKITNRGSISFHINRIGIQLEDRSDILWYSKESRDTLFNHYKSSVELPHELQPRNFWECTVVDANLYKMKIVNFVAEDKTGVRFYYKGKKAHRLIKSIKEQKDCRFGSNN
ncbi:hypothetical protein HQ587_10210 [bacterium]|nr:hypothetical protein [bacterium]